jgi:alpha,alpha-trehalase
LFDLDGVLTETAGVHAATWKRMFDDFLRRRAAATHTPFVPFEIATDYRLYVDGKPRYDGVRSFLNARHIRLPEGREDDPPEADTVYGLGQRKNTLFTEVLRSQKVQVYDSSVACVQQLRRQGIRTAVVSSSQNCRAVLQAAGIAELFEVCIDGQVALQLHLAGKPAPDTYLKAAKKLGVSPARAVVIEDAVSGVQAGRAGRFGLVIGVDRHGDAARLQQHGADIVVTDLSELGG